MTLSSLRMPDRLRGLQWRSMDRSDAIILSLIVIAHVLIIGLLARAAYNSGLFARSQSVEAMELYSYADVAKPEPKAQVVHEPQIAADVVAPDVEIDAPPAHDDPFGGAALRVAVGARSAASAIAATAEFDSMADKFRSRVRDRVGNGATELKPVVIEVLAKPTGGFIDVRIKQSSGAIAIDQELLAWVMLNQALVAAGQVAQVGWQALPAISLRR